MHKFIESDVHNGLTYLKCAIMNALWDIEEGHETKITLGKYVPFSFVIDCAKERGWIVDPNQNWDNINGWECDTWWYLTTPQGQYVMISGSLIDGIKTQISICNDDN